MNLRSLQENVSETIQAFDNIAEFLEEKTGDLSVTEAIRPINYGGILRRIEFTGNTVTVVQLTVYKEQDETEEAPDTPDGGFVNLLSGQIIAPDGWSLQPKGGSGAIWASSATWNDGVNQTGWSVPYLITGITGAEGPQGDKGDKGDKGEDGADGIDGTYMEYIYFRGKSESDKPSTPSSINESDYCPEGWSDRAQGVDAEWIFEWRSERKKEGDIWQDFTDPILWAKYGEKGKDGDGIQYIFKLTSSYDKPTDKITPDDYLTNAKYQGLDSEEYIPTEFGWTDDPEDVSDTKPYCWSAVRKYKNGQWEAYSEPTIWAKYSKDGESGVVFELSDDQITLPIEDGHIDPDLENHPVSIGLSLHSGFTKIDNNDVTYSCDVDGIEIENGIATINFTESVRNILFSKDCIAFTAVYNGVSHTKNCSLKKTANAYELIVNKTTINLSDEGYFMADSDGKILGFTLKKWNDTKWETSNITMDCGIRLHYYPGYESNAESGIDVDGKAYTGSKFTFTNGEGRWFNTEVNLKQSKFQWVNEIIAEITIDGELYRESISCLRDERALHLELTNEFTMVPTDSTGNIDSNWDEESDEGQDLAISTAQLYIGSERVTDNVTWNWTIVSGEGTLEDATTDTCSLITMTSDSVTIKCTATFANRTISKEMNVVKSKGQAVYKLVPSASLFTYDKNGVASPSSITIAIQKWDNGKYSNVTASGEGLELSASTLSPKKESQTVTLKKGGIVLDEETIGFVESGKDGEPGKDGAGYLKNLLVDSANLTITNDFKSFLLPVRVSTGDVFTFKAESVTKINGDSSNFFVYLKSNGTNLWEQTGDMLSYGNNVYRTFTVTTANVKDQLAELILYSGKADSYNATVNFTNFSLVKGSKPMEEWEDYKGDEGLKNLLMCDYEYTGEFNKYQYYKEFIGAINAGEKYTLSWEKIEYSGENVPYPVFMIDGKAATSTSNVSMSTSRGWVTLTIRDTIKSTDILINNLDADLFISKDGEFDGKTATIHGLSLVKGSHPMMKWKSGKSIENGTQGPAGPAGQPGEDAFVFDITNNSEMVPCDGEGNVDATWSTQTTMTLYKGSVPVTEGVTYKVNDKDVTSNVVTIGKDYVTGLSSKVKCEAIYNGITYTKEITLTKAIGVTAYRLVPSTTTIRRDKNGNFTPTSVTAKVMGWSNGKWVTSTQGTVQYCSDDSSWSTNQVSLSDSIDNVYIRLLADDGTTVLDKETIPIIWDGNDGKPGDNGVSPTITKKYALNNSTTAPNDGDFKSDQPLTVTSDNKYCWCLETITQGTSTKTSKYIISMRGEDGGAGVGSTGAQGPIIYPAGVWRGDIGYSHTMNDKGEITATPYVFWAEADTKENAYYKLLTDVTKPSSGSNPTPNNDSQHWQKIEYFDSIFADVGFFNQATVGQFVFHKNYVFSQEGVNESGTETTYNAYDDPADAIESGTFKPNILFNAVTGDGNMKKVSVEKVNTNITEDGTNKSIVIDGKQIKACSGSDANAVIIGNEDYLSQIDYIAPINIKSRAFEISSGNTYELARINSIYSQSKRTLIIRLNITSLTITKTNLEPLQSKFTFIVYGVKGSSLTKIDSKEVNPWEVNDGYAVGVSDWNVEVDTKDYEAIKFSLSLPGSSAVSVSGGYLSGKISIDKNVPASTYIGNTGFVSCNSEVSASVTTDGFLILSGNYGLKITSLGINITKDGGQNWTSL